MGQSQEQQTSSSLNIAILTVSDRRSAAEDSSGDYLQQAAETAGHQVLSRNLLKPNLYQIRAQVSAWIADDALQVILVNGGTGFNPHDQTPEALAPLFDQEIPGIGELFRLVSYQEIGTATLQSRAVAGMANRTLIVALPGSPRACQTAWEKILVEQLDAKHRPCNFVTHLKQPYLDKP